MEACHVNTSAPLSCCEGGVVPSNQSFSRLEQHGNSQQGAEVQWYMREQEGETEEERGEMITFIFLFESKMSTDYLSQINICQA